MNLNPCKIFPGIVPSFYSKFDVNSAKDSCRQIHILVILNNISSSKIKSKDSK